MPKTDGERTKKKKTVGPALSWKPDDENDVNNNSTAAAAAATEGATPSSSVPLLFLPDDEGTGDQSQPTGLASSAAGVEAAADSQARKVLLKNLAFSVTSKNLEDFCSACGALQNAFVVMDKSGQRSRGFGYAQYATVDGATAALVELNGKELQGRRIVIQRPREKTDEAKQKKKQERKAQKKLKASLLQAGGDGDDDDDNDDDDGVKTIEIEDVDEDAQDAAGAQSAAAELRKSQDSAQDSVAKLRRAGRTVLIWGLPSAAPEFVKKFEKSVGSCGKVDQVIVPAAVPLTVQEHLSICAEVAFVNKVSTKTAVRKFDRQQWNVATGNRDNTKKSKASAAADRISFVRLLASMAQTAKARKSCRLIVRNLTFKATRKDVVDAFARFGPIAQVHMPDAAESLDERKKGGKVRVCIPGGGLAGHRDSVTFFVAFHVVLTPGIAYCTLHKILSKPSTEVLHSFSFFSSRMQSEH